MLTHDNPHPALGGRVYENIQLNYEKMRQVVLSQGYDRVWIVEEDMIPPLDAFEKLSEVEAPVVTGLYCSRHGDHPPNLFTTNGHGLGLNYRWKQLKSHWGKSLEVGGGCMGCVLLGREVLEGFNFITGEKNIAPDLPLMDYCCKRGFKQVARLDVVCGHVMRSGDILWPDRETGFRIEAKDGTSNHNA